MINSSIAIQYYKFDRQAGSRNNKCCGCGDFLYSFIDLRYEVGPETTVEGPYETLIEIIRRSNEICTKGAQVYTYVKINYAPKKTI